MLRRVFGYEVLVDFEKKMKSGTAVPGTTLLVDEPSRAHFEYDSWWHEACSDVYYKSMKKIGQLIASGKMPENTTIKLYISNHANKDFKYIADAIKSGKCPKNFKLIIDFDTESALEDLVDGSGHVFQTMNPYARKDFAEIWIPQLEDVLGSGQCPLGLDIQFRYPLNNDLKDRVIAAKERYALLIAQQQAIVLAQGSSQSDSSFPKDIYNLICFFLLNPEAASSPQHSDFVRFFKDKSLLISANSFLQTYWSWNSSAAAEELKQDLTTILALTVSVHDKAKIIRQAVLFFLEKSLGANKAGEYVRRYAVTVARRFNLFDNSFVEENPEKMGSYRLTQEFHSVYSEKTKQQECEAANGEPESLPLSDEIELKEMKSQTFIK